MKKPHSNAKLKQAVAWMQSDEMSDAQSSLWHLGWGFCEPLRLDKHWGDLQYSLAKLAGNKQ
jgi:hypothetical protein